MVDVEELSLIIFSNTQEYLDANSKQHDGHQIDIVGFVTMFFDLLDEMDIYLH